MRRRCDASCSAHDPTEDTESLVPAELDGVSGYSCSAHDPTEDTERRRLGFARWLRASVAVPTIRPRILKGQLLIRFSRHEGCCSAHDPTEDTERDLPVGYGWEVRASCSAHDPTEDTERRIIVLMLSL